MRFLCLHHPRCPAQGAGRRQRHKPGPKKGSHNKKAITLPEADNPLAAARLNVEAHRHLSEKINYRVLDDLFEETVGVAEGPGVWVARVGGALRGGGRGWLLVAIL
jgi:hypothetical protein